LFAAVVAAVAVAMGVWKLRWWLNAGGPAITLLVVVLAAVLRELAAPRRWVVLLTAAGVCYLPDVLHRLLVVRSLVTQNTVQAVDLAQPLYRDLAASLRASRPSGSLIVLASPNASAAISYFARCQTLGTLYWENTAGLKAAAGILCARTDAEALALIRERGVTHLALTTHENYLAEYLDLLHPGSSPAELENTFGHRVLFQRRLPAWLRLLPYRPPPDIPLPGLRAMLLEVVPEQTATEAQWHVGVALLSSGEEAAAESCLQQAIAGLPPTQRPGQFLTAGNLCYRYGLHGAAVRFFRAALAAGAGDPATRNLAWILATSREDRVRQGHEALALVSPLAGRYPDDHDFLSLHAAALAETGRFAEAAVIAARALAITRAAGDARAVEVNTARLAGFQAGRPWRQ
jgi:tetratricopeptide (TPR) repeat protein